MSLERLWNGWRSQYVRGFNEGTRNEPGRSVFTAILQSGSSDEETHIVHRGPTCFAILNAFPYSTGHMLVLPYREVADLEDLDAVESVETAGDDGDLPPGTGSCGQQPGDLLQDLITIGGPRRCLPGRHRGKVAAR